MPIFITGKKPSDFSKSEARTGPNDVQKLNDKKHSPIGMGSMNQKKIDNRKIHSTKIKKKEKCKKILFLTISYLVNQNKKGDCLIMQFQ